MIGWLAAAALYGLGVVGFRAVSIDFSNLPRTRATKIGVFLWPGTVLLMGLADLADAILDTKKHN